MLFNSHFFIFVFLPIVCLGYHLLNKAKFHEFAKIWLIGGSLYFYSYFNISYLPLIVLSVLTNYMLVKGMMRGQKFWFIPGLVFNIGLLCYFKYMNFFLENFSVVTGVDFNLTKIIFPLGISFYTLQQIAYLVDVYQDVVEEEKKLVDYAVYVTFFPCLISGPIAHYDLVLPQFQELKNKVFNSKNFSLGIYLFCLGLFKKVIIADSLSPFVNESYENPANLHLITAWATSLGYTLQLYFDFSGYTDMAIGIAKMFNISIPQNFNSPLRAANINDFWSRWHMTLTSFIKGYIYTPIIRSMPKPTFKNSMIAMFIAMTIAGIWHGPAWTFVLYGMVHGLAIVVHHNWKKKKKKLPYLVGWFITFNFVNLGLVLFRAPNLKAAGEVIAGMMGLQGVQLPKMGIGFLNQLQALGVKFGPYMTNDENILLALIVFAFVAVFKAPNSYELEERFEPLNKYAFASAVLFVVCMFGLNRVSDFIYFNF